MSDDGPAIHEVSDAELRRRFVARRDEGAFRELVQRHGPLVLSVCRRNTFSEEDAEDAFQATFLVLAESARKVRRENSLPAWLYGVALRTSGRVRRAHRRGTRRLEEEVVQYDDPLDELLARHEGMIADEELAALPDKLRAPLVLRYLAGKSNHETAEELGISVAALEGRLKRGKQQLRTRLLRRGVTLAAVIAVLKATRVHACELPEPLATAVAAMACGGQSAPAPTNSFTHSIARQELSTMNAIVAPKLVASVLVSCSVLFAIGAHLAMSQNAEGPGQRLTLKSAVEQEVTEQADAAEVILPKADAATLALTFAGDGAATSVKPDIVFEMQNIDAKPRSELERHAESRLGDAFERKVEFVDTPLNEVVDYLQSEAGVTVVLDTLNLDDLGITVDTPVTAQLPEGLRLNSVLKLLLDPLELEAIVKDEVIYVTTQDDAASLLETRVYPTNLYRSDSESLARMLTQSVQPDSWVTSGGAASIEATPSGALIIRQTFGGHQEVASILGQMATTEAPRENANQNANTLRVSNSNQGVTVEAVNNAGKGDTLALRGPQQQVMQVTDLISEAPPSQADAVETTDATPVYEKWTERDQSVLDALVREYETNSNKLQFEQDRLAEMEKETGSPTAPQNALLNELDKQQIDRLQQELLEVRRLDAVSAGGRPVQTYREELRAEIESLAERVLTRTERHSSLQRRQDEISQLKREIGKLADSIAQLRRKQIIGQALEGGSQ